MRAFTLLPYAFLGLLIAVSAPTPLIAQNVLNPFWKDQSKDNQKPKAGSQSSPATSQPEPLPAPYLEPMQSPPSFATEHTTQQPAPAAGAGGQTWRSEQPSQHNTPYGSQQPGVAPRIDDARGVERGALAPVMAGDSTHLPYELWRGLSVQQVEQLIASLTIPPRSTTIHNLWTRLILSEAASPGQGQGEAQFAAIRSEALFRSGLLEEAHQVMAKVAPAGTTTALFDTLKARAAIAAEQPEKGCPVAKGLVRRITELPKSLAGTASLIIGYCAALDNNRAAAGLAADLAQENGLQASSGITALRAFSVNTLPRAQSTAPMTIIDYRILQLVGGDLTPPDLAKSKPPLLAALAKSAKTPKTLRVAAGEAALAHNAITVRDMAEIYRSHQATGTAVAAAGRNQDIAGGGGEAQRAALFNAAEAETMPLRKARSIRAFLDVARRAGFYWHALQSMAEPANQLASLPEIAWFAETGIETSLAAGNYIQARRWAAFAASQRQDGGANLGHWIGLIDIADPGPAQGRLETGLAMIEKAAVRGQFDPVLLHRLATVLDALDTHVPIPLWEIASRTPQPTTGHLPETGILSALQTAAKNKEYGHMALLTMKTLGPNGAEGAHMIALGDSIRALKRGGLKKEARQLGVEALFGSWPRAVRN
ncbi:MAG: hypothetical protein K0U34_08760 [Alphaproteobacteria bacterium]|nr:hypothetical protein [Alphaproteobacteria bacterium]